MDKFLKEYDGHRFEDWGTTCSTDFKSFCRKFKNYLKRNLPGCEVIGFKANHYDTSGFIKKGEHFVYVSYSWNRFSPVDINEDGTRGVLYRVAHSEKDYRGELNHFVSLKEIPEAIKEMIKVEEAKEID